MTVRACTCTGSRPARFGGTGPACPGCAAALSRERNKSRTAARTKALDQLCRINRDQRAQIDRMSAMTAEMRRAIAPSRNDLFWSRAGMLYEQLKRLEQLRDVQAQQLEQVRGMRGLAQSFADLTGLYQPLDGLDETARKAAVTLNALTQAWAETREALCGVCPDCEICRV
jgi:hypothetical protein